MWRRRPVLRGGAAAGQATTDQSVSGRVDGHLLASRSGAGGHEFSRRLVGARSVDEFPPAWRATGEPIDGRPAGRKLLDESARRGAVVTGPGGARLYPRGRNYNRSPASVSQVSLGGRRRAPGLVAGAAAGVAVTAFLSTTGGGGGGWWWLGRAGRFRAVEAGNWYSAPRSGLPHGSRIGRANSARAGGSSQVDDLRRTGLS